MKAENPKAAAFILMTKSPNSGDIVSTLTTKCEQIDAIILSPSQGWDIHATIYWGSSGPFPHPAENPQQWKTWSGIRITHVPWSSYLTFTPSPAPINLQSAEPEEDSPKKAVFNLKKKKKIFFELKKKIKLFPFSL